MDRYVTTGIVLKRINYGEADRIITFITPHHGKISVLARGVRRAKSKLAGGIELFSESSLTVIPGKGSLDTLASSRLEKYYGGVVKDLDKTAKAYDFLQLIESTTEDDCDESYYRLLAAGLGQLDTDLHPDIVKSWFLSRLLTLTGHTPELARDVNDEKLTAGQNYIFDYSSGRFQPTAIHGFSADAIKLLRLLQTHSPRQIQNVKGVNKLILEVADLLQRLSDYYLNSR